MNGMNAKDLHGPRRPRRRGWALPTLLAALSGLVVGALVLEGDDRAEAQRNARLAAAERTVVYTVTPTEGPRFRLQGGAETVLLVAHLQLPREPYHAGRTYRFAVIATLRGPDGALLHRWSINRRTRQTKADPIGQSWGFEAAFVPDGRIQITDGAAIELHLPQAPPRSTLELRLAEEAGLLGADDRTLIAAFADPRALVRVYRQVDVDEAEASAQAEGEGKGAGSRRLATYLPWHALDGAMRRRSVGTGWERIAAEGHTGVDYEAQGIYVAAARPSAPPPEAEPAIEVGADQPAIVHLQGPARVTLRARLAPREGAAAAPRTGEGSPAASAGAAIDVHAAWLGPLRPRAPLGDDGELDDGSMGQVPSDMSSRTEKLGDPDEAGGDPAAADRGLELPGDGSWAELTVPIPRGWTSLEVVSRGERAELQVLADDPGRHVGVDPHDHHRRADGQPFVPVDLRSAPLYVVGPAASPLLVDLGGPADVYARVIRVDARAVGGPHPLPLQVEFLDREGRVVGRVDETLLPPGPAPFERLQPIGGRAPTAAVQALLAGGDGAGASRPAGGPGPTLGAYTSAGAIAQATERPDPGPERGSAGDPGVDAEATTGANSSAPPAADATTGAAAEGTTTAAAAESVGAGHDGLDGRDGLAQADLGSALLAAIPRPDLGPALDVARELGLGRPGPIDRESLQARGADRWSEDGEELAWEDPAEVGASDLAGTALGFPLGVAPVSEPASLRLIAPRGAVRARIRGQAPALVVVRGLLPPAEEAADGPPWAWPYDQVVHGPERWRYAPLRRARWFPIEAVDHRVRVDRGEVMLLQGQVRREAEPPPERAKGPWEALHPSGDHPRLAVLERVSADRRAQAIADWGAGSFTALRRGATVAFDLGREGARPPSILAQVTGSTMRAIGHEITVRSDDHLLRWPIRGRLERQPLPTASTRRSRVTWTEGPPGVVLLVDRPPRSPAPIYRRRQLHQLGKGGLTLEVDKPTAARMAVNVVIYWVGAAPRVPTQLRVELDGGAPRRRTAAATTRFTAAARTLEAAPTEQIALLHEDARGEGRAHVLRAVVVLGDDVAAGRHTVQITPIGGPPVWLRFFRQGGDPPPARAWQWQERRDGLLVEVDDVDDALDE